MFVAFGCVYAVQYVERIWRRILLIEKRGSIACIYLQQVWKAGEGVLLSIGRMQNVWFKHEFEMDSKVYEEKMT